MRLFLLIILLSSSQLFAQSDSLKSIDPAASLIAPADSVQSGDTLKSNWKRSVETGLNLNQASFSGNWKGGGVTSTALGVFFLGRALYETDKVSFNNDADLQYGFLKNKGQGYRKNLDKILLDTKIGYRLSPKSNIYTSVNFISQFADGFEYNKDSLGVESPVKISEFMSPAYLTSSFGYEYKPVDWFYTRLGVGSLRQTFVLDTTIYHNVPKNYGVPIGRKVRNEVAFMLTVNLDKDLGKNVNLKSRFTAFANYETLKAVDTRLDVMLTAKVNRYINVNLSGTLLYDQDMDYEVQYTQALTLAVLYKFSQFDK